MCVCVCGGGGGGGCEDLVPRVLSYTRETLENACHVSPRRKNNPEGVPVSESFVATKFCKHQNEAHFWYFATSRFASVRSVSDRH